MPSGKIHDTVALISAIPVFLTGNYVFKFDQPELYIFTFAVLFSQMMFGPDLDSQSCQYKRWGIIRWMWIPYRKIFAHRSRFSHGIIFGPILRCVYLTLFFAFFLILLRFILIQLLGIDIIYSAMPLFNRLIEETKISDFVIPITAGIFLGAAIHTFTDKIVSFFKNLV